MLPIRRATLAVSVSVALIAAGILAASTPQLAAASVSTQLQTAQDNLANCLLLASRTTGAQRSRAQDCVTDQRAIIALLNPTTPPTTPPVTPSVTPSQVVTPTATATTVSPTVPPTSAQPTAGPTICPAWPAVPDANCTGYQHTGVVLKPCSTTLTLPTYDGCRFVGTIKVAAANIKITRSYVDGGHVEGSPNTYDLRNVTLQDVEIRGPGNDGSAAVGNNNYTCIRCNIHAGLRGFALGGHVLIQDSYAHDFYVQPAGNQNDNSVHQTAISTHGGSDYQVLHSNLRCSSDGYACSAGFSFYAEDTNITNVLIKNCKISTDAGYGLFFDSLSPGKPFGITNTTVTDNVLSSEEYGPVANWPSNQAGNVWSNNRTPGGTVITP